MRQRSMTPSPWSRASSPPGERPPTRAVTVVAVIVFSVGLQYLPRSWAATVRTYFASLSTLAQGASLAAALLVITTLGRPGCAFIYYKSDVFFGARRVEFSPATISSGAAAWATSGRLAPRGVARRALIGGRDGRSGQFLAVRRILAAGLICFALWTFFDARQLYQGALNSPIGLRRSVAMTILRPIARVEEALSLDRLVDGLDRLVGKTGTPGGSAFAASPLPPATSTNVPQANRGHKPPPATTPSTQSRRGNPRSPNQVPRGR